MGGWRPWEGRPRWLAECSLWPWWPPAVAVSKASVRGWAGGGACQCSWLLRSLLLRWPGRAWGGADCRKGTKKFVLLLYKYFVTPILLNNNFFSTPPHTRRKYYYPLMNMNVYISYCRNVGWRFGLPHGPPVPRSGPSLLLGPACSASAGVEVALQFLGPDWASVGSCGRVVVLQLVADARHGRVQAVLRVRRVGGSSGSVGCRRRPGRSDPEVDCVGRGLRGRGR